MQELVRVKIQYDMGLLGHPVIKTLTSNARGAGSILD